MAYVDLNSVRAELAGRIEDIRDTSIFDRLRENSAEALEDYLRPVLSGLDDRPREPDAPQPERPCDAGRGRCQVRREQGVGTESRVSGNPNL